MTKKKRYRRYSPEFKRQALRRLRSQGVGTTPGVYDLKAKEPRQIANSPELSDACMNKAKAFMAALRCEMSWLTRDTLVDDTKSPD